MAAAAVLSRSRLAMQSPRSPASGSSPVPSAPAPLPTTGSPPSAATACTSSAPRPASSTGALEQPAVFRNNDLPGVMLGSAAQRLAKLYGVRPGREAVV